MANTTMQDVANMLTRPSENDISITASRKGIQLKNLHLQYPLNTPAKRARVLAVVASVETGLGEGSVEGFLVTLAMGIGQREEVDGG